MKRLNELKTRSIVFTTDTENSPQKQKELQIHQYKKRTLEEILDVPRITIGYYIIIKS
jgi:hypothetical protein